MSRVVVNLARRPFINTRPVVRLALLLWIVGVVAAGFAFWKYLSYFEGSGEQARRMADLEMQISAEQQERSDLSRRLAGMDLGQQNSTVRFLNRKIDERTFAWSRLFDQLANIMPSDVRLVSLRPDIRAQSLQDREIRRDGFPDELVVPLEISIEAKNDESLFQLVDALFEHRAFRSPNPQRETLTDTGLIRSEMTVDYLPGVASELAGLADPVVEGAEAGDAEAILSGGAEEEPDAGDDEEGAT